MFGQKEANGSFSSAHQPDPSNEISGKSSQLQASSSKNHREEMKKRMRLTMSIQLLPYKNMGFKKFSQMVEGEANPYSLLRTIFAIVDEFQWRQYISHLQALIKKFTNEIAQTNGRILEQLSIVNQQQNKGIFEGYTLQERIQSMLYLSNKIFQDHLLILIHGLIAYNRKYCLLDESSLSQHLLHRHGYEKYVREEIIWLLTRMSINASALIKIFRNYFCAAGQMPILPILMILSNYTYEQPNNEVEQLIQQPEFHQILEQGFCSQHYETEREAVLVCNNIVIKSQNCAQYMLAQTALHQIIVGLNNQQVQAFRGLMEAVRSHSGMNEEMGNK